MHVCVSIWTLPQMKSYLCCLVLSSLAVSSQLGLEDVFFSPQDQSVREGDAVFFRCVSGESSPPAGITWLKDEKVVTRGRQIQGEYGGGHQKKTSGTLHLYNVTLEDDGTYACVTHNPSLNISNKSKPAKLTVQGVPRRLQIVQGPDNITVAMGTEISMHCAVHGFPVPMVHWFKNGCHLTNCSASFSLHNNGQLLTFRNVTKEDEGSYHCEASNQEETIKSQPAVLLPAEMDWSFEQQPVNLTVKRGENVTVTCRPPTSRPAAQVSWFQNNQLLTPTAPDAVLPSGDLFFHSIQEIDSGSYFCRASNIHLQRFLSSRRATLTVLAPPSVTLWPQMLTVPLGARVLLECQVSGHPLPTISWIKRGHSKQTGGKVALGLKNASLHIPSARSYDEGVYVCEASNPLGHSRSTATLRVAVSPVIVNFAGRLSFRVGTAVVLPCRAVGILPITYTWTRGRAETQSPISPSEDTHIDGEWQLSLSLSPPLIPVTSGMFDCCAEDGALHISNVQWPDGGEYYCNAENRAGRQQRRTLLTVTDQDPPNDRLVLYDSISTNKELPASRDSLTKHHQTTHHPYVEQPPHGKTTCSSSICETTTDAATTFSPLPRGAVAELTMLRGSHLSPQHLIQPTTNPTQLLDTQIQHPVLTPAPHPNFQSVDYPAPTVTDAPVTHNHSLLDARSHQKVEVSSSTLQYQLTENQFHLASSRTNFPHQVIDELLTPPDSPVSKIHAGSVASQTTGPVAETSLTQSPSKLPVSGPLGFLKFDSYLQTPAPNPATQTISGSVIQSSQSQSHRIVTESQFYQFDQEPTTTLISRIKLETPSHLLHPQPSPAPSQTPHTHPLQFFRFLPKFHLELLTTQPHLLSKQPPPSSITTPQTDQVQSSTTEPYPTISTLPQTQNQPSPTQQPNPSISTIHPHGQTSDASTLDHEIPIVPKLNISDKARLNVTLQGDPTKSANDTELTEWLKRNTSQSPMTSNDARVTQQSPSWLPLVEKHDIPVVVGVGVSLAFIFITVTFYAVVQKNEAAPTNRAAQRNVSVPVGTTERRAAGRTYENRAFEDDDCVAVIEQSPNTSDTRARPPGPSLVTVQMERTFEDLQEDTQPALDNHSVTVETYPEPILDTKIDPEEEKRYSLSQPSIQLQSSEDWTSNRGNDLGLCHDALPPPSSLPSRSPSPSPPSRREEGLRSSVTLQSAEQCLAPIHHSLSVSHGNPPLLLSHHVSLGLTTVAVDVHFYPAATALTAGGSTSHISTVSTSTSVTAPLFSPPFANSRESDQSTARSHK